MRGADHGGTAGQGNRRIFSARFYRDIDPACGPPAQGSRANAATATGLSKILALPPQMLNRDEGGSPGIGAGRSQGHGGPDNGARGGNPFWPKIGATLPEGRARHLFHADVAGLSARWPHKVACRYGQDFRAACSEERALLDRICRQGRFPRTTRTVLPLAVMYTERCLTLLCPGAACVKRFPNVPRRQDCSCRMMAAASFRPRRVALLRDYLALLHFIGRRASVTVDGGIPRSDSRGRSRPAKVAHAECLEPRIPMLWAARNKQQYD